MTAQHEIRQTWDEIRVRLIERRRCCLSEVLECLTNLKAGKRRGDSTHGGDGDAGGVRRTRRRDDAPARRVFVWALFGIRLLFRIKHDGTGRAS